MKARFAYEDKQQLFKTYIGRNSSWHVCSSTNPVPFLAEGPVVNMKVHSFSPNHLTKRWMGRAFEIVKKTTVQKE